MAQTSNHAHHAGKVDAELIDFLHAKIDTFVKWDLIRYFHDNPHARDTADNIAQYTGRDMQAVEAALAGLVAADILREQRVSKVRVYDLAEDPYTRDLIHRFVLACDDREFRVMAIYHVIEAQG
ncbi:MAG: hypothetical protein GYB67_02035 [Chloroflexi bacterium]|nr:hypothetical protein [Chloroflexota bacterium]